MCATYFDSFNSCCIKLLGLGISPRKTGTPVENVERRGSRNVSCRYKPGASFSKYQSLSFTDVPLPISTFDLFQMRLFCSTALTVLPTAGRGRLQILPAVRSQHRFQ